MKKIIVGIFALLFLTGCSGDSSSQTLFVADKNDRFGLININGDKQTKFIYDKYESVGEYGYIVVKDKKYGYMVCIKNNEISKVPLQEVAGKLKTVDPDCSIIREAKMVGICFGDE